VFILEGCFCIKILYTPKRNKRHPYYSL
jgi:hypothetical protein